MGGFIKGIVVGIASFAAGFALLAVILPPSDAPEPELQAQATPESPPPDPQVEAQAEMAGEEAAAEAPVEVEAEVEVDETAPEASADLDEEIAEPLAPEVVTAEDAEEASDPVAEEPATEVVAETGDDAMLEVSEGRPEGTTTEGTTEDADTEAMAAPETEIPEDAVEELATETPADGSDEPAAEVPVAEAEVEAGAEAEAEVVAEVESEAAVSEGEEATDETAEVTTEEAPAPNETVPDETAPDETGLDASSPELATATEHEVAPDTAADAPESLTESLAESLAESPAEELPEPAAEPAMEPAPVLRAVPPAPPQPGLNRVVEGVTTGRLPAIGAEVENGAAPAEETAPAPEVEPDADLPAYRRFAAAYDPAPGLPLFGIILIDAPNAGAPEPAAEAALLALPFAVSVALDPADADAPRRAAAYRQAGHEVLILAEGLPRAAQPSDIEVTLEGWLRALPEAVGLLDTPEGAIQGDRQLAQRLAPALAGRGLALVMPERGLNPAQQSARSAGLAHATVFRILDAAEENPFTIRRYLDRATFRAQQEGQVLVLGHAARADTLDGLIGWRMEGRAGQVAIVPVSALLRLP